MKTNDEASSHINTYVRNEFGLLVDCSVQTGVMAQDELMRGALVDAVAEAAAAGQPLTKTGANGVFKQRHRFVEGLRGAAREKLEGLVDEALERGDVVQCAAKGTRTTQYLDIPSGDFALGRGVFTPGAPKDRSGELRNEDPPIGTGTLSD